MMIKMIAEGFIQSFFTMKLANLGHSKPTTEKKSIMRLNMTNILK